MPLALPSDIADALARAKLHAEAAEILTLTPDPAMPRALYRVRLDTGRIVKARRLESEDAAARQQAIRAGLPPGLAAIIARSGAVLIEEWIEGRSLAHEAPDEAALRTAGRLLAAVHATPESGGLRLPHPASTAHRRALSEHTLDALMADRALDRSVVDAVRAILADGDPGTTQAGVTHLDFCGENMVIDAEGQLRVIDNERVCVDALGFDLARAWYRWALGDEAWAWFCGAYLAAGGSAGAVAQQRFWRAVAVCMSALFRVRSSHSGASRPLEVLRRLVSGPATGGD